MKQLLKVLGKQFNTPVNNDGGEMTIELPENLGLGFIRGTSFSSGIGFIEYNVTFFKDLEIHFTLNQTHPLKFIFCSQGKVDHSFEENDEIHTIDTYQNIIVSSSGHNGHVLFLKQMKQHMLQVWKSLEQILVIGITISSKDWNQS